MPRDIEACRSRKTASPPVPSASRVRCFRSSLRRPRWQLPFQAFPVHDERLATAAGPSLAMSGCRSALHNQYRRGPSEVRLAPRDERGSTANEGVCAASPAPLASHRIPPRVRETRTPLGRGGTGAEYIVTDLSQQQKENLFSPLGPYLDARHVVNAGLSIRNCRMISDAAQSGLRSGLEDLRRAATLWPRRCPREKRIGSKVRSNTNWPLPGSKRP